MVENTGPITTSVNKANPPSSSGSLLTAVLELWGEKSLRLNNRSMRKIDDDLGFFDKRNGSETGVRLLCFRIGLKG